MGYKIKKFVFILILCGCGAYSFAVYAQHPPEPRMGTTSSSLTDSSPCDPDGGGFENQNGTPITPPPGLCLPINDYLYPLLIAGLALGAYQIQKVEKAKEI